MSKTYKLVTEIVNFDVKEIKIVLIDPKGQPLSINAKAALGNAKFMNKLTRKDSNRVNFLAAVAMML